MGERRAVSVAMWNRCILVCRIVVLSSAISDEMPRMLSSMLPSVLPGMYSAIVSESYCAVCACSDVVATSDSDHMKWL